MNITILFIWLLLMQITDIVTTYYIIYPVGSALELNPIMEYFIDELGIMWGLILPKVCISIFAIGTFIYSYINSTLRLYVLWSILLIITNILYTLLIIHNLIIIFLL